ncbi:ABC-type multidrug transport system fused ATPase/permease subunit [Arcicella aurantiaca]|uniref:ABC-type multidrug transport system fused ATPase/permease subunit n=1 Tax=Arcicella aurantiaca TaxID=591202 RepID=A0A316EGP5_9BACT|nr:ABC transporter transmembrane domain-containing protein [Arcicella aurantiaca]PWK28924.1 ABC-type multidrug transport system fused ATPase/permease subunit [Arcicella aurantiaca]
MAKRNFGAEVAPEDKKKVTKEGFNKALSIFKFTLPYKGTFFIGFIFLILSQITSMSIPLLMGQMVGAIVSPNKAVTQEFANMPNSGVSQRIQHFLNPDSVTLSLNNVTALFVFLLILQAVFSFFRVYTFARVSERSMRDLRRTLYTKIITLPVPFFEKNRVGDLMSRMTTDISQLQDVLSITLAELFRQLFTLIGGIILISYLSSKLTLFMLMTFPFLVVAAIIFGRFIRKNAKKVQDELASTNIIVEETLQSINVVKAFTNEDLEAKRYSSSVQRVVDYALKAATFRGGFISFVIFVLFGGVVGVVWYGGNLVLSGELAFKDLFTFIIYTGFIGGSVGGLGDMYAQIQRTIGASERILEILREDSEINLTEKSVGKTEAHTNPKIVYQNVAFSYPSRPDVGVLKNISLEVKSGEKIGLVGYSGAGKSTIVQLLMRYYKLSSGNILVDGKNINDYDLTELRKKIAIVPQEVMLFGGTIYENISYGNPNASEKEVIEAARKANAFDFIDSFPEQFQTIVGERGVKLSGGQRQRIAIARAILKDPAILVLDEATSALDSESEKLVQDALDVLMQNRTTIIIAHRLATIRNVDTIYVLKEGEVAEKGSHDELVTIEDGIYANLVKLQFENNSALETSL